MQIIRSVFEASVIKRGRIILFSIDLADRFSISTYNQRYLDCKLIQNFEYFKLLAIREIKVEENIKLWQI